MNVYTCRCFHIYVDSSFRPINDWLVPRKKTTMHILRIIAAFLLFTFGVNTAIASDRHPRFEKPDDVVAWLYRDFGWQAFIGQYFHEIINDQPKNILERYFTPRLTELIMKERRFEIETKQVGPPGFDLLFGSQDPDGIRNIRISRKPGTNTVSVLYDQDAVKDLMEIQFETVKTKNGWRISDVRYKMNKSIDPNFDVSLIAVLSGPY
jgi:hypothetical protein